MIKAVIFDMDGVIVDSEPLHYEAHNILLGSYGHSLSDEHIRKYAGINSRVLYTQLKEKLNLPQDVDALVMKKKEIFLMLAAKKLKLMPHATEFIGFVKANGFKVAIASSGLREQIHAMLNKFGLLKHFETIVSVDDVKNAKPHPEIYLEAIRRLGLKSSECIAIEDSDKGIASAKQAGLKVIAVPNKYTEHQDLSMADLRVSSLKEITLETIKNMARG
jgi:HAD superfamily hydrolase (TIGR01509 family)